MANVNDMFLSLIEGLSFQNGVYVDNQKDNETLYEVNRMGSSEALDPQNIKKIVKKTDDAKLFMVDMFDLHIGGQAHKSARARMVFDFVAKTRNAYTVLGGDIFGIKLYTDGVIVVGTDTIETDVGDVCPAEKAGLKIGDVILFFNES